MLEANSYLMMDLHRQDQLVMLPRLQKLELVGTLSLKFQNIKDLTAPILDQVITKLIHETILRFEDKNQQLLESPE